MSDIAEPAGPRAPGPLPARGRLRPRWLRPNAGWALASAALTGVSGAALLIGAARGSIGASVATAWLQEEGVPAQITVERLDAAGFTGRVRLGPAEAPDFVSEHVELTFTPTMMLRAARLVRPQLKLAYDGQRLRFGSLQRLVDNALSAKPTGAPGPDILVEDGLALMSTPAGPMRIRADARLSSGELRHVDARLLPAHLLSAGTSVDLTGARLVLDGVPGGAHGWLRAAASSVRSDLGSLADGVLALQLDLGLRGFAPTGRAKVDGVLTAGKLTGGGATVDNPRFAFALNGAATGPLEQLALTGDGRLTLTAAAAKGPSGELASRPALTLTFAHLETSRTGARLQALADLAVDGGAGHIAAGAADLESAKLSARYRRLELRSDAGGATLRGAGRAQIEATTARLGGLRLLDDRVRADGAISLNSKAASRFSGRVLLAGGLPRADAQRLAASLPVVGAHLATALTRVSLVADHAEISGGIGGQTALALAGPLRASGAGRASLTAAAAPGSPLLRFDKGALSGSADIVANGLGLSRLRLSSTRYALQTGPHRFDGQVESAVSLALDRARVGGSDMAGLAVDGPVQANLRAGAVRLVLPGCASVKLARFGASLRAVSSEVCPGPQPLLQLARGRWRAAARFEKAAGELVSAQVALAGAALLSAQGGAGPLGASIELAPLTAQDLATKPRFAPLAASGRLDLGRQGWSGRLALATGAGQALGGAVIAARADGAAGQLDLDTGALIFAQNGFQLDALSPLAPTTVSKLDGPVRFVGQIAWRDGALSHSVGRLETTGLDFTSPLGRVSKARGAIALSSLTPLETPPGQAVTAESVAWIAPLDSVRVAFQLTPSALRLEAAQAGVSGGRASLDPLSVSLGPGATTRGVLRLAGVDVGQLIARSTLSDKLNLQAKLSGAVPFAFGPEGVRITDGRLAADGPGRLSINRAALAGTDVKTSGVQDIAYQALENLAFDTLDATVGSQPKGRLGVLFHINGRHDPPRAVETRIGLFDLIGGHALDKSVPLPKGTPVNLTLDTSLNFDELLAAYQNAAAGRSEPVQGQAPK